MLGKGLESLIPPQKSSDENGAGLAPQGDSGGSSGLNTRPSDVVSDAGMNVPVKEVATNARPQFAGDDFRSAMAEPDFSRSEKLPFGAAKANLIDANFSEPKAQAKKVQSDSNHSHGRIRIAGDQGSEARYSDAIFHIEVEKIKPNPTQPRKNFDEKSLWELAHSIREFGFLQPLVVTKMEKETPSGVDVGYQLIAGERRLLAAKLLGLTTVPALIRNVDLEREKLELAVVENIQREDLNAIERARAMAKLQDEFRMTQREVASKLGKSREVVANTVRLLDLPTYVQEALERGQITESHGRFLLAVQEPGAQKRLFDDLVANRLTTRDLKNRVRLSKAGGAVQAEISPELKMMEEKLSAEFGTPVKIERGANTGKITITFYSDEELQSILDRMGVQED
jgi:ParB family chromosome partitioning protein